MPSLRGLYAIVDLDALDARGLDPLAFTEAILRASPAAVQLRAKHAPRERTLALLSELGVRCRAHGVPLVANDHIELALHAGCDALHVGQEDVSPVLARRIAPTLALGISTHDPEQLSTALSRSPWYVAYGPIFSTASKEQPDPVVGIEGLRQAARIVHVFGRDHGGGVPLVAIGGIDARRAELVAEWADAVAVIAGLLPSESAADPYEDVTARARAYAEAIARGAAKRGAA